MSARIGRVFSVTVTTALYRRYRPDSFADVIGQEHVTGPLMTALRKNRVNHAYLFSGPRGCGKTTSARILARCLNCAQGPTDTPCGTCPSCVELARGGSGSLDVIEIDAASHGGVDDARDLRERATFAPVRDRYKIFIIDEAHMVTSAGFNALLKIVEEPPEHIKFIFATTEPDKVIGTIRSRTHHYPFRLVPPEPLMAYLELLCRQENVQVAPGVLSLVIRAGGGSVRDSLSVLDQLMAGAGPNGLDYELAVALLGYTHASLLDDVVEAVAASDAATVFRAVDRVIQTGHDPRRFVEDLLERFRDLVIVQAMPESAQTILRGMPADQIARLKSQAHNLGAAELSRAADVTNTALTEMTGATSPRLHLELLCARILLPSSEQNERGIAARIDRVERRLNYAGNDVGAPAGQRAAAADEAVAGPASPAAPAAASTAGSPASQPGTRPAATQQPPVPAAPAAAGAVAAAPVASAAQSSASASSVTGAEQAAPRGEAISAEPGENRTPLAAPRVSTNDWPKEDAAGSRAPGAPTAHPSGPGGVGGPQSAGLEPPKSPAARAEQGPGRVSGAGPAPASGPTAGSGPVPGSDPRAVPGAGRQDNSAGAPGPAASPGPMGDVEVLRRAWPDILQTLSKIKRSTWALVEPNAQVAVFDGNVLTLAFTTPGLAGAFGRADHSENLRQAIHKTIGIDCQINASTNGGTTQASSDPNPKAPANRVAQATSADVAWGLAPAPSGTSPQPASAAGAGAGTQQGNQPETKPQQPAAQGQAPGGAGRTRADGPAAAAPPYAVPAAPAAVTASPEGTGPEVTTVQPGASSPATQVPAPRQEPSDRSPYADPAGDYSYSDDDWGPARDEDAPPLDEEPPMDWDPSSRSQPAAAPAGLDSARLDPAGFAAAGSAAAGSTSVGSTGNPDTSFGKTAEASPASRPNGQPGAVRAPATDTDPWARAVEQAPGVWVVGEASNVGRTAAGKPDETPLPQVPRYEPATAPAPPSIPVVKAGPEPDWGLAPAGPSDGAGGAGEPEATEQPLPDHARVPEYAMASTASAPAVSAQASPATVPRVTTSPAAAPQLKAAPAKTAPSAPAGAAQARQSLYQRLSNSPEAEAGRAKAPARAVAAAANYVQDIPSADDETIEESGVFGRAAVERILGGKLIEERSPDGSPIAPRY
ncbi:DNA polymerase III subunit gamma and tau [Pseudarthrobacter sp. NamE5]|uniref:DNA polymerase III subunit gamma and tau n=1 Tax=Pseudarthrobacter sp. NamE5 TaxID=2576839 RepID=UPI00110ABFCE|nr:DNA polymerase III subunit gamma and tau [Pseudarthrobacter sp. NamE5]TLM87129.1 DNA polymerase III subunit gamma and tau [Pseudarthrobacter sp. NamE5]